jgi:hypothetical protein
MPTGRPTSYHDSYPQQAEKLCELGATDAQIADFFKVHISTLYLWKHTHPEFSDALKAGKSVADETVVRSLYQRACGYEQDEVKIFMPAGSREPVIVPHRVRIAADTTAAIFWLKNRRAEEWRDRSDVTVRHEISMMSLEEIEAEIAQLDALDAPPVTLQ